MKLGPHFQCSHGNLGFSTGGTPRREVPFTPHGKAARGAAFPLLLLLPARPVRTSITLEKRTDGRLTGIGVGDREGSPKNFFFGEDRSREYGLTPAYHLLSGGVAALRNYYYLGIN